MPRALSQSKIKNRKSKITVLVPLLLDWFAANARDLPWRRTSDPYAIWVSEIMLQQTQVKTVVPYWERWMRELPTIRSLADATPAKIHKLWEGLGYYRRVEYMQRAAQTLLAANRGQFPNKFHQVLLLPGIGRYTAGAICSIAFNQPTPVLDGNIIRVLTRVFGIDSNPRAQATNDALWSLSELLVKYACHTHTRPESRIPPPESRTSHPASRVASSLNQSLMELGALVCTPRDPKCNQCPVSKSCVAFGQGRVHELPSLGKRAKPVSRRFAAFLIRRRGRFLVRQRPAGVVNAHLWEFPNVELQSRNADLGDAAREVLGFRPQQLHPFCAIRHSITHYRITLEAHFVDGNSSVRTWDPSHRWHTPDQLETLAFPSAHRQILRALVARDS